MAESNFDLRLIPEYDGSDKQSVIEWLEKLELVCKIRGVADVASVIPLRLTGGAFAVYLQLPEKDRKSTEKVKEALISAFVIDPFMAYEQFAARKLQKGESPDVFLAELRRLASLFGGMSDKGLACAFVVGLPENVRQLLRAGSRLESLDLSQILTRARAVIKDDCSGGPLDACLGAASEFGAGWQQSQCCYECNGPNHFARDCLLHRRGFGRGSRSRRGMGRGTRRGYTTLTGSGNEYGEEVLAPTSSLVSH
ncbi:hypothetical protein Pmani_000317 [Petrolisthes manimaculis]|uniref:CCHC-type domain-containing protein n=1 Tax=Petrolisthes manimaculis TaxID=1843537 RepID=A0AAE1ULD9_9EUCA|nr:hypothetical protein Pmani_000317 [Petrolisthes manimaculis]